MTLIVGHRGAQPIEVPNGDHVLLIGPPASGKTAGFLVPSILGHRGPALVTSSKSDVAQLTRGRANLGRRLSFTVGQETVPDTIPVVWDPIDGCQNYDEAILRADAMVQTARVLQGDNDRDGLWFTLASRVLAALLYAVARAGRGPQGMVHIVNWVTRIELEEPLSLLQPGTTPHSVLSGLVFVDDRVRDSVMITLTQCLRIYDSPALQRRLAEAQPYTGTGPQPAVERFDPRRFVQSSDTLYIVAPLEQQVFFAALVVGLIDTVSRAAMALAPSQERLPREQRRAVVLALDEVANIAPLRNLPRMVSAGSGQGIQVMAVLQDLSQAKSRWQDQADGFITLFKHKVVLPGVMHAGTLEALSKSLPHLSAQGHPIPEYLPSSIAALRPHAPGSPGEALWIEGARPERVNIFTIHDFHALHGR